MNVASTNIEENQDETPSRAESIPEQKAGGSTSRTRYRIHDCQNCSWVVFDQSDEVRFSGTLEECEEWLDLKENQQNRMGLIGFFQSLFERR